MKSSVGSVGKSVVGTMSTASSGNHPYVERLIAVRDEALQLLDAYGLTERGWRFQFSNTKNAVGTCYHSKKVIAYSQHYAYKSTPESVTDTLLHEIAHALVGTGHGHDYTWQRKAIELGADPYASCQGGSVSTAKPNYRIKCPNEWCGWSVERFRMKQRNFGSKCPKCGTEVEIYKLTRK